MGKVFGLWKNGKHRTLGMDAVPCTVLRVEVHGSHNSYAQAFNSCFFELYPFSRSTTEIKSSWEAWHLPCMPQCAGELP